MKWKHFSIEKKYKTKGKIPGWFRQVEKEVLVDEETRRIKDKFIEKGYQRRTIHMNYYDEDERLMKNEIVTWNDGKGLSIFEEDKKCSQSNKYKRIGYHLIIKD
ncbi:hypothetical protein RhiirC2_790344 [Rhizophagus irregularis]|uniref:Uncharacterized protein n=1 Tax=Rhizophagus irregularis TaxID=588596 RepID=A0A2N1MLE9_9GLOM|nr:hypothetical protein RhiirC2_790344 [Rhizophagus irregularis]